MGHGCHRLWKCGDSFVLPHEPLINNCSIQKIQNWVNVCKNRSPNGLAVGWARVCDSQQAPQFGGSPLPCGGDSADNPDVLALSEYLTFGS